MKNTTKKLVASSIALGLAGVTAVGSTLAWFTTNTVSLSGVSMTTKEQGDLRIALDGQKYDTTLDLSSGLTKVFPSTTGQNDARWDLATSADGANFYRHIGHAISSVTPEVLWKAGDLHPDAAGGANTALVAGVDDAIIGTVRTAAINHAAFTYEDTPAGGKTDTGVAKDDLVYYVKAKVHFAIKASNQKIVVNTFNLTGDSDANSALRIAATATGGAVWAVGDAHVNAAAGGVLASPADDAIIGTLKPTIYAATPHTTTYTVTSDTALSAYNDEYKIAIPYADKGIGSTAKGPGAHEFNIAPLFSTIGFNINTVTNPNSVATGLTDNQATGYVFTTLDLVFWYEGNDVKASNDMLNKTSLLKVNFAARNI